MEPGDDRAQRRHRPTWNKSQLEALEEQFKKTHYPDIFSREELAFALGVSEPRIQVWFSIRRAKARIANREAASALQTPETVVLPPIPEPLTKRSDSIDSDGSMEMIHMEDATDGNQSSTESWELTSQGDVSGADVISLGDESMNDSTSTAVDSDEMEESMVADPKSEKEKEVEDSEETEEPNVVAESKISFSDVSAMFLLEQKAEEVWAERRRLIQKAPLDQQAALWTMLNREISELNQLFAK